MDILHNYPSARGEVKRMVEKECSSLYGVVDRVTDSLVAGEEDSAEVLRNLEEFLRDLPDILAYYFFAEMSDKLQKKPEYSKRIDGAIKKFAFGIFTRSELLYQWYGQRCNDTAVSA